MLWEFATKALEHARELDQVHRVFTDAERAEIAQQLDAQKS